MWETTKPGIMLPGLGLGITHADLSQTMNKNQMGLGCKACALLEEVTVRKVIYFLKTAVSNALRNLVVQYIA